MRAVPVCPRVLTLFCAALALAACAPRLTRLRSGWHNCRVGEDNAVLCAGRPMAQVECLAPHDQACTALVVRYADGQRVFLAGLGYEADPGKRSQQPEQIEEEDDSALHPEIATDASALWYARGGYGPHSGWKVFDLATGMVRETDRTGILLLRDRVVEYRQLWRPAEPGGTGPQGETAAGR